MAEPLHAFAGVGIEIEYMIVDRATLSVRPCADALLRDDAGRAVNDVARGLMGWSNELAAHLVEIKNREPVAELASLVEPFQAEVREIDRRLSAFGARLMPSAVHPWMDPRTETRLWPHGSAEVYRAFDRIFDCARHGWSNLQSVHINLPFGDDAEFERLHAALRLVLPILPALAAASPVVEGRCTGFLDYRMLAYRDNSSLVPSIAGAVVPETLRARDEYERCVLQPMYRDIAAHDTEGLLQHEWLNARGAIARFDRSAIEVRVCDAQEYPGADLAIAAAATSAARGLYEERWSSREAQQAVPTQTLAATLESCIRDAEQAVLDDPAYLALFGYPGRRCAAGELWQHLALPLTESGPWSAPLHVLLEEGPLARRMLRALGGTVSRPALEALARGLCDCLAEGRPFHP